MLNNAYRELNMIKQIKIKYNYQQISRKMT